MLRFVPPAGAPLAVRQIFKALTKTFSAGQHAEDPMKSLARRIRVRHAFALSSGRAALWAILRALHRLRPQKTVVAIPAYICFSVPASIARAGLKIEPVDIDFETLDFDYAQLQALPGKDLLCIVASNLFGLVCDFSRVAEVAQAKQAFVIDNAAQALGASLNEIYAGTRGDAGLFSLGRGKAATVLEGGIAVTDCDDIADAMAEAIASLPAPAAVHEISVLLKMLAYAAFLHPHLYWLPNSLPWLGLGVTEFAPSFRTGQLSKLAGNLLTEVLGGLEGMNQIRRRNAVFVRAGLDAGGRFRTPAPLGNAAYTRLPLIACDHASREQAVCELRNAGIGASPFYPSAICDIEGIGQYMARRDFHCRNAEELSRRLFTVPTHPYVGRRDLQKIVDTLNWAGA
jgi:perosamine synthetase